MSTIVHSKGCGGQNLVTYDPCSCWMIPMGIKGPTGSNLMIQLPYDL